MINHAIISLATVCERWGVMNQLVTALVMDGSIFSLQCAAAYVAAKLEL
jgi:hypothetical protein